MQLSPQIIEILISSGIMSIIVSTVLAFLLKKFPNKISAVNVMTGELGELLTTVAESLADGKLNKDELNDIGKEGVDSYAALKKLLKSKKKGK